MNRTLILLSSLSLGLVACGSPSEKQEFSQKSQSIIGGLHADSSFWNHTGALAIVQEGQPDPFSFCTGTLIAPETVVTAKHCTEVFDELAGIDAVSFHWIEGSQLNNSQELIPIVALERASVDEGGFVGRGQDVAVVHLDFPSSTVPASVAPFTEELLNRRMISLGYGVFGARGQGDDQRRIGRETVAAVEGLVLEAIFGDLESFTEWRLTGQVSEEDFSEDSESFAAEFEQIELLQEHEAVTGLADGDTQSCNGDSGGPLGLLDATGQFQTFGVVSGGLASNRQQCDFGTVFATFGPKVIPFLEAAQQWEDPCGDATQAGVCDGTTLLRCETNVTENTRVVIEKNCAVAGQFCVTTDAGAVCGSIEGIVPQAPEETDDEADEEPQPTEEEVTEAVENELQRLRESVRPSRFRR